MIVVGAGGHARVVASILAYNNALEVVGYLDNIVTTKGEIIGDNEVLGDHSLLPVLLKQGVHAAFIAVGDNDIRAKHFRKLTDMEFDLVNLSHPSAFVEQGVIYGTGNMFAAGSIVGTDIKIGNNCIINTGAIVDHETTIGNHIHIAPGVSIAGRVEIKDNAFIGIGAIIKEYVTIGHNVTVGAGSVVLENLPDNAVAVGSPARVIRFKDRS